MINKSAKRDRKGFGECDVISHECSYAKHSTSCDCSALWPVEAAVFGTAIIYTMDFSNENEKKRTEIMLTGQNVI